MRYVICILFGFIIGILVGLIGRPIQEINKCPSGQYAVVEEKGTPMESIRCYTPGVTYTDYRPRVEEIEGWRDAKSQR